MTTPLQTLIYEIEAQRDETIKLTLASDPINSPQKVMIGTLSACINRAKQLLEAQQNSYIDFAQNYKSHCFQNDNPVSARQYYNEQFKNE